MSDPADETASGNDPDEAPEDGGVYVDEEGSEIIRLPSRTTVALSLAAGLLTTLIAASFAAEAAVPAVLGLIAIAAGGIDDVRWAFDLGGLGLFLAVVVAGIRGAPVVAVLAGAVAAVLSWDVANHGAVVGRQLGRESPTRRIELVHAAGSLAVGAVSVGVGYLLYALGPTGLSATVVAVLIVAAGLLVAALRS